MAPLSPNPLPSQKRSLSQDDDPNTPAPKRLRRPYHHYHTFQPYQRDILKHDTFFERETIDQLLCRSIGIVLNHDGFEAADPVALESFRAMTEEFMLHFCASIRRSMISCRRTQPIPQDFELALRAHDMTLSSLLPHLNPPVSTSISQPQLPTPPPEPTFTNTLAFLGLELSGANERPSYIPAHFPPLPSKHTYKASPVYTEREQDPRKIREKATEEGRLGEEALRKIVASSSRQQNTSRKADGNRRGKRETAESVWEKTVQEVLLNGTKKRTKQSRSSELDNLLGQFTANSRERSTTGNDLDIVMGESTRTARLDTAIAHPKSEPGPVVNAERRYWRRTAQEGAQKPTKEKVVVEAQDAMAVDS